ncbi:unnamed protein product (macronuclear) [Paramecium tetraurelia]|uniref:Uncharacterized protein n=1 Tax=Paramecium tetraurelia TaxID=5888 RepID=A0D4I1_PARTE|nr:uncharacterized protein GSPATT00013414001 [Paramecium tetraurelia]CAK77948.1 unnamed protein product [Paramecium tetraurelia]|eukprot:XP_001445345.1 hypothetical protein (macronuclear) [Paramecium tetraurelia strain d4-2]
MKRERYRKNVTIKREILEKKNKISQSFVNLESRNFSDCFQEQTRSFSCYGTEFGQLNKFQIRFKNILPDYKTKQSIHENEMNEKKRRQTLNIENVDILKFYRGIYDINKSKTLIKTLKMLKTSKQDFDEVSKQIKQPHKDINKKKKRRSSCYCALSGKMSEKQIRYQHDPYFDKFNMFQQQRKLSICLTNRKRYQDKLKSQIQQENIKISYISQNKSPINKYKCVSRTTKLILEQTQTKILQQGLRYSALPSQRFKTEPAQSSPRSFKLYPIQLNKLRLGQSTFRSSHLKESFKTLANIYR